MKYANKTTVSPEKSRQEIERTLVKYGAKGFHYGWNEEDKILIEFKIGDRNIRYIQQMPKRASYSSQAAFEQALRQRWRGLAILIKGKLDAVENGTVALEQEFYASILLPNGRTIYEETQDAVRQAYLTGKMQKLLTTKMAVDSH